MFTAAIITMFKSGDYPNVHQWMNELKSWYMYTRKYYSATQKKNEVLIHTATWMNLENIMPHEEGRHRGYISCGPIYVIYPK